MTDDELLAGIQSLRTFNNVHWMGVLKLALHHAPVETRQLIADISRCDAQVQKLAAQLGAST